MIELRLTIDPTKEPVTGQLALGAGGDPLAFIGYVELISALERMLPLRDTGAAVETASAEQ
jgi:hypothetical protein